jgi:NAD dependent epimerase/dehydratase family enzyme
MLNHINSNDKHEGLDHTIDYAKSKFLHELCQIWENHGKHFDSEFATRVYKIPI